LTTLWEVDTCINLVGLMLENPTRFQIMKNIRFLACVLTGIFLSTVNSRANVYATDIKLNGSLSTVTNAGTTPVTITYRLNQSATEGATVGIWQGTTQIATIVGGTNMGLNTVVWGVTNSSGVAQTSGTFGVSVTASAVGFTNWQQISVDTNAGNYAFDPNGMAVDNNSNSPYYGRVIVGCSYANGTSANPINGQIIKDGIYKMNADGSFADEGGFGYGGYTMDDGGHLSTNEMSSASFVVPWRLRIGGDDRIYMDDYSDEGAIVAFDMEVTTNQVVIDDGGADGGALSGLHTYANCPDFTFLSYGIGNFDVSGAGTSNAAVWLCNNDYPNWGIWMWHMTNGQSVTNDAGTQALTTGGYVLLVTSGGCMIDTNLDIFCAQTRNANDNNTYFAVNFTNWNKGDLPLISSSGTTNDAVGSTDTNYPPPSWGYCCGVDTLCTNADFGLEAIQDVAINSRTSPTIVAFPTGAGNDDTNGSGIRLLDAVTGDLIVASSATNIDFGQEYPCAAWDNVGNLYGASSTRNVWRVWSPPGGSTNTTLAVAQVTIGAAASGISIVSITATPTTPGCASVTITFTGPASLPVSDSFKIVSSDTLNGTYAPVADVVMSGAGGTYTATFSNCSTQFYKIGLFDIN
jgi:hypothetical protein